MVGRDVELREMARLLDALDAGTDGLVLQVAGQAGVGKSRLLAELGSSARERGQLVLAGRAAEFEGELPFGVFVDALDDWLASLGHAHLAMLAGGLAGELAVVFPALEALVRGERPPELWEERFRAYRAVRALLSALASDAPVVLVLDDVHWADPASLELICHLLAHPPLGSVLVVLGFRPAQLPAALTSALAAALRDRGCRRVDLLPLSAAEAAHLLAVRVPAALRDLVYHESGGNPFFLLQLARGDALADRRRAARGDDVASVPGPVRAALASELSSLSSPALVLLQGAAVAGDPFELRLAAEAADHCESGAIDLVDELLRFQFVTATGTPGRFAFRHPIVRAGVYDAAGRGWRARAHARVVEALTSRQATPAALAPHVERSAIAGDGAAVELLVAAGDQCAPYAPALAARWYGAALALLPAGADTAARQVSLQIAMATALGGSGQLRQSQEILMEVLERLPEEDPERPSAIAFCAGVEHLLGRHRSARARLTRAHELAGQDAAASVALKIELAAGGCHERRFDEMLRWSELALEQATRRGERPLALVATGQIALAHYHLGRESGVLIDRAAAALDAIDDGELATRLDLGLWIGWTETLSERYERAVEHCERIIAVARATGQGAFGLFALPAQAQALMFMGRLDAAAERIDEAIEAGRLAPSIYLGTAIGISSIIATYRGHFDVAVRAGRESVRLARDMDPGQVKAMSGLYLAAPLIEMRRPKRARDVLLATGGGTPALADLPRSGRAHALEILTEAELMLGDLDAAERSAGWALEATYGGELAVESAFAQRALAAVVLARGDAPRAARIAFDAAGRAELAGGPAQAARCRILAARALIVAGRRDEAIAELDDAVRELARIGADGYRAQGEALLRRLGRRVARRPGAGSMAGVLESLAEPQRELAELVRRGHTNRQIATMLFVSEKTVERRLSLIFDSVGVANRTALASLVASRVTAGAGATRARLPPRAPTGRGR
jgi:tetratricopeptide (TPR) repeat protein/DNA-binding CsgD family transcriptional regulator